MTDILKAFDVLEKALLEAGPNQAYRHAAVALSAIKSLLMSAEGGEEIT